MPAPISEKLTALVSQLTLEEGKFDGGKNSAAGGRARKLLQEIKTVAGDGRKQIQEARNAS